jgi:hypothetical protein
VVHTELTVLDFNLISGLRKKGMPAWEGIWYGLNVLQIVKGRFNNIERCFMFVDNAGVLELWEMTLTGEYDMPTGGTRIPISAFIETRAMEFGNDRALKRLDVVSLFVAELFDTVNFVMRYRPDDYPCWVDWHEWSECNTVTQCFPVTGNCRDCKTIKNFKVGYRPKLKLPVPADVCDSTIGRPYREFFAVQLRLEWAGKVAFTQAIVSAIDIPEPSHGLCPGAAPCKEIDCCVTPEAYNSHG